MTKTIALFFVLGLMVSCASQHERSVSSIDGHEKVEKTPNYETTKASFR